MFQRHFIPTIIASASITLSLSGCSASDHLTGTWEQVGKDLEEPASLQIFDDGSAALSAGEKSCRGKLDTDSSPYKIDLDCTDGPYQNKGIATVHPSDEDNRLQLRPSPNLVYGGSDPITFKKLSDSPDYESPEPSEIPSG